MCLSIDMAATTEQPQTEQQTSKSATNAQQIDSLFPDLTPEDRTEVDQRLHPLMQRLDGVRLKLKVMAKQELSEHHHSPHLQELRSSLDEMENNELSYVNGVKVWGWTGPPSRDIPSGQAVLTDLLEQSRELERYIRGGNLPAKPRHHKRRGSVARRARNWFQALKGKIMSWTYTSTTVHHGQQ